jgi:hypothetical protein
MEAFMGGVVKAIGKAIKGVFNGIKKVFKAVVSGVKKLFSSTFGKVLLVAAAVFFGGAALGFWASPFSATAATAGAGVGSQTAAGMVAGAEATGGALAGGEIASGMAAGAADAAGVVGTVAGNVAGVNAGSAVTSAMANSAGLAPVVTAGIDSGGTIIAGMNQGASLLTTGLASGIDAVGSFLSPVTSWMEAHPTLTKIGGNILQSMFSESEADQYADAKIKYEKWLRENSTIAGIGYNGKGPGVSLAGLDQVVADNALSQDKFTAYQSQWENENRTPYQPSNYFQPPSAYAESGAGAMPQASPQATNYALLSAQLPQAPKPAAPQQVASAPQAYDPAAHDALKRRQQGLLATYYRTA